MFALVLLVLATVHVIWIAVLVLLPAGVAWIGVLSTLNAAIQTRLPAGSGPGVSPSTCWSSRAARPSPPPSGARWSNGWA